MTKNKPSKKVIIFDDDEDILSICRFVLEDAGWTVHSFLSCENIEEKVAEIDPQVILMDNWIPPEGGAAATSLLKSSAGLRHIPVIYFSANSNIEALAVQAGADAFLSKPFELEDLEEKVRSMAGGA